MSQRQVHWLPITEDEISDEEALEKQRRFEEEVEEKSKQLEHPYLVGLEYCGWLPEDTAKLHKIKQNVMSCHPYCCFNHQMGMPTAKIRDEETGESYESEPIELYDYERDAVMNYERNRYYGLNKIRGSGISEVLPIRHMTYKYAVTNPIRGRKFLLAAGINQSVAVKIFQRILDWVKPYVNIIFDEMPSYAKPRFLKFRTGGEAYALSAEPNAPRSLENVGDILLDEAAHWDLQDDEPVLKAYEPFVAKSGAHIGIFSTPGGQRGFFWSKIFNPEIKTKYFLHVITLEDVMNVRVPIIDTEEAQRLRETDPDLYAQEFGNKFILPSTSVFGDKFEHYEGAAEF